jgi:hypothetical protein
MCAQGAEGGPRYGRVIEPLLYMLPDGQIEYSKK